MDPTTVLGMILAFGLVISGILSGSHLLIFLDVPAALIVFGGVTGATLVSFPPRQMVNFFRILRKAFVTQPDPGTVIPYMMDLAARARREGILALEPLLKNVEDSFLRKGLQLTVDGLEPESIREIMQTEISYLEDRHETGAAVLQTMGTLAPALGLVGTLIGLVQMLQKMSDPTTIGPAMAVGLVATFYGVISANLLFIPLANKLRHRSKEEILLRDVMLEGILCISKGENPRILAEKMNSYLPPRIRTENA